MNLSPTSMGILIRYLLAGVLAAAQIPASPALAAIEIGTTVKVVNQVRVKTLNRRLKLGDDVVHRETVSTGRASADDQDVPGAGETCVPCRCVAGSHVARRFGVVRIRVGRAGHSEP